MPTVQAANNSPSFSIKLLSGKNVVLVDCAGFESELFMPQIVKGRINFQNIIPTHRCCDAAALNQQTDQLILPASKLGGRIFVAGTSTPQRYNYDNQVANISTPLAKSTPANPRVGKENVQATTPEQVRSNPMQNAASSPLDMASLTREKSMSFKQPDLDVDPMLHVSGPMTHSPPLLTPQTSLTQSGKSTDSGLFNFMHKAPPAKTYARRKPNGTNQKPKPPISWSPLRKKKVATKVSSTKALSPAMKLEVKHRKLIVDSKKSINTSTLYKITDKPVSKTKIKRMQVTGKTRAQFEALKDTAFDHLTMPGQKQISLALIRQFKEACLDKYSETLPNYAELSQTLPLQMDRQVKALISKEKRLEKQMTKSQRVGMFKSKMRN